MSRNRAKASWNGMQRRSLPWLAVLCLFFSTLCLSTIGLPLLTRFSPAFAQTVITTEDAGQQVYRLDPDLPLENQYVSKATGKVSETNTLVSRLVRYHTNTKGRPPLYRLDWKLTLADYLGVNDRISTSAYPGADALRPNPVQGDIAAIQKLTRAQRETLVEALVTVFSQAAASAAPAPSATPSPSAAPAPSAPQAAPSQPSSQPTVSPSPAPRIAPQAAPQTSPQREPRPGDAELLLTP